MPPDCLWLHVCIKRFEMYILNLPHIYRFSCDVTHTRIPNLKANQQKVIIAFLLIGVTLSSNLV